ncbi:HTH-type transcriptional regulator CynR [compost metagenome]
MDHRLLEYFMAVCEELHFTRAAEKLGISQPTLSQQIRLLEERLGTPLIERIGKKNYITEAGHILLSHSKRVFHELEQAQSEINELMGIQRGKLRIGCSGNHLLTTSIISFHQQYPGVQLSVLEQATEDTREGLLNNELDIGVVFLPLHDDLLVSIPLFHEELSLVVAADHPFAASSKVQLEQLQQIPMVLLQDKFFVRQMIDERCEELGFMLQPILELSTMESLLQLVSLHIGATILPQSYVNHMQDDRVRHIDIVKPTPQKSVGIVYRKDIFMSSTMKAFIEHLIHNIHAITN